MTTKNPLGDGKRPAFVSKLTAAEWAAEARDRGKLDIAKMWDQRAAELDEERIPNGTGIRFRKDRTTYRVDITK